MISSKTLKYMLSFARLSFFFVQLSLPWSQLHAQAPGWDPPRNLKSETTFPSEWISMAVTPSGKVFAVWMTVNQPPIGLKAQLFLATYDGLTWSAPVAITDTGSVDQTPDVASDTLGYPHVVWEDDRTAEIYYMYFDGAQWSQKQNVSGNSGASYFPRIAIDKNNTAHIVWHDNTFGSFQVLYRSFTKASGWSPTVMVSDSAYNGDFPRLVTDSDNTVHITFTRRMPPNGSFDVFYRKLTHGNWSRIERITYDDSLSSNLPDITLDRNDKPVIVWVQRQLPFLPFNNGVYFSTYSGSTWSEPVVIKDTTESDEPSIAFDRANRAHVVWELLNRVTSHSSILYSSGSTEGGRWSQPVSLSSSIAQGVFQPVVRTDTSGMVHVLWACDDHGVYYTRRATVVNVPEVSKEISPAAISLKPNYPNPFNSSTIISYVLNKRSAVSLKVFDVLGREVQVLVSGEEPPGEHVVRFIAGKLSSGVYFFRLQSEGRTFTRQILLLR